MSGQPQKQGTVRRGQKTPYRKSTNAQIKERTEWLALYLLAHKEATLGELKSVIKERMGIQYRMAHVYIARAKQLIQDYSRMSKSEARQLSLAALVDNIQNGNRSERNGSLRLLADIFGLDAPKEHRVGDAQGRPLAPAVVQPQVHFIIPDNGRDKLVPHEHNGCG